MCNSKCGWGGCIWSKIGRVLVVVGGVNWGLIGLGMLFGGADWNVVRMILGSVPMLEAIVYVLVGVAAVIMIFGCKCDKCKAACAACVADTGSKGGM